MNLPIFVHVDTYFLLHALLRTGELHLYGNYFEGEIPKEIGNMKNLGMFRNKYGYSLACPFNTYNFFSYFYGIICEKEILDLYANFLKGSLPTPKD